MDLHDNWIRPRISTRGCVRSGSVKEIFFSFNLFLLIHLSNNTIQSMWGRIIHVRMNNPCEDASVGHLTWFSFSILPALSWSVSGMSRMPRNHFFFELYLASGTSLSISLTMYRLDPVKTCKKKRQMKNWTFSYISVDLPVVWSKRTFCRIRISFPPYLDLCQLYQNSESKTKKAKSTNHHPTKSAYSMSPLYLLHVVHSSVRGRVENDAPRGHGPLLP